MSSLHSRIAAIALALVGGMGCVSKSEHQKTLDDLDQAQNELRNLEETAQGYMSRVQGLEGEAGKLRQENQSLRTQATDASARWSSAQAQIDALNAQLAEAKKNRIPGVDVDVVDGRIRFAVQNEVLFDSGKAEIKASGRKTLAEVAKILKQGNERIEVAGHTDTDPVAKTKDKYPLGNIELGTERALRVWKVLLEEGVPASRMHVSSYAEHQPYKGDPKDKAKNRRVDISVEASGAGA